MSGNEARRGRRKRRRIWMIQVYQPYQIDEHMGHIVTLSSPQ
jgi:hypothetical protein